MIVDRPNPAGEKRSFPKNSPPNIDPRITMMKILPSPVFLKDDIVGELLSVGGFRRETFWCFFEGVFLVGRFCWRFTGPGSGSSDSLGNRLAGIFLFVLVLAQAASPAEIPTVFADRYSNASVLEVLGLECKNVGRLSGADE